MTSDLSQTALPIAIPIKDFRDEEIVDFFANKNRTFQSAAADDGFGRSRLVGSPHFTMEHKGTAAFRVSFRSNSPQPERMVPRCEILREETVTSIPIPPDILSTDLSVLAATITDVPKKKRAKTIEPSFAKPTQPLASVLMMERKNNLLKAPPAANVVHDPATTEIKQSVQDSVIEKIEERLRETDEQLSRLIETWPRLSTEHKETISAILKNSESESPLSDTSAPSANGGDTPSRYTWFGLLQR